MSNELDIPEEEEEALPLWSVLLSIAMLAGICIWSIMAGHAL